MRRILSLCLLLALPVWAHVVSMSNGYLTIEGEEGRFELRMPLYEIEHVRNPEAALFENLRFSSGGEEAKLVSRSCREDTRDGAYVCEARYRFAGPVERLHVRATLHAVTVPNHVHLLRVDRGDASDRAVFDYGFPEADLRFVPPAAWEVALEQFGAGLWRAIGGLAQLLFLAAVALAGRTRRELAALGGMLLCGVIATSLAAPAIAWTPAPRFLEAAMALTIAYLAVEILLLPEAGARWLVVGVLGVFHGFYFSAFLEASQYRTAWVLGGVALGVAALLVLFHALFTKLRGLSAGTWPVKVLASLLMATGLVWFVIRVWG